MTTRRVLLAGLALGLAACGGGSGDGNSSAAGDAPAVGAPVASDALVASDTPVAGDAPAVSDSFALISEAGCTALASSLAPIVTEYSDHVGVHPASTWELESIWSRQGESCDVDANTTSGMSYRVVGLSVNAQGYAAKDLELGIQQVFDGPGWETYYALGRFISLSVRENWPHDNEITCTTRQNDNPQIPVDYCNAVTDALLAAS